MTQRRRAHRTQSGVPFRLPVVPSSRVHFLSHTLPSLMRFIRLLPVALLAALAPVGAQTTGDPSRITVERIFATPDFRGGVIPQPSWLSSGSSYIIPRPAKDGGT